MRGDRIKQKREAQSVRFRGVFHAMAQCLKYEHTPRSTKPASPFCFHFSPLPEALGTGKRGVFTPKPSTNLKSKNNQKSIKQPWIP